MQGSEVPFLSSSPEIVEAWVVPDIAAVTAVPPELDIVPVRGTTVFEDQDQLVLAPIQRAHAGIVLDPDAQIFELGVDPQRRGQ